MSTTGQDQTAVPDELASPRAKLVYLYLASTNGAAATEVADHLSVDKLTVLSILQSLSGQDLIRKQGTTYTCIQR